MTTKLLSQGWFRSVEDIERFDFIDWNRAKNGFKTISEALRFLGQRLIDMQASYTLIERDMRVFPERDDWPGWEHNGRYHERLGRLYWNTFHALYTGTLEFSDEPDFGGEIDLGYPRLIRFEGDIGKVSPITFSYTTRMMDAHDMWISVLDEVTELIIVPDVDYSLVVSLGDRVLEMPPHKISCPICKLD